MAATQEIIETQPPEEPISSPAHLDGIAYLYGHPLLNSLSPPLHQTIYNALGLNWQQIPLSSVCGTSSTYPPPYTRSPPIQKFLASIRTNPKFVGSSVTMPWKVRIMPHLDDLTEDAKQAGACNTIFVRTEPDGRQALVGTNTDCIGIREALLQNPLQSASEDAGEPYCNKPALIIGAGGTARAAIYVMRKWLGVSRIYIANRDWDEVDAILEEDRTRRSTVSDAPIIHVRDPAVAASLEAPAVIVSGIPNYAPQMPDEIQAREVIRAFLGTPLPGVEYKGAILEMCYHPVPWTEIAELATVAGWKVILGSEALIWQGIEQARLWTGKDIASVPGLVAQVKSVVTKSTLERAAAARSNL